MSGFFAKFKTFWVALSQGLVRLKTFRLSYLRKVFSLMGKKEKTAVLVLVAVAVLNLFASLRGVYDAHTVLAPAGGGLYTEGVLGQPEFINPLLAHQDPDLSLTELVYSGLYKYDQNGILVPDLAESLPAIASDQKQYTVKLRHNVRWHNAKPFTADDVVFTVQTLQDPNFKSPLRSLWSSTTVEKIDDYTVKFTTKDISEPFVHHLTLPLLSKSVWGRIDPQNSLVAKYNLEAVGTGPYDIKEIKKFANGKIDQITFESFSNYYNGRPNLDTIVIKFYDTEEDLLNAFHSKEVTGFGYTPLSSNLVVDPKRTDTQILAVPLPQYQVAFFNLNSKLLSDPGLRQALALGTDRQKIISEIFNNNARLPNSPLTKEPDNLSYDFNKASQALDALGWKLDLNSKLRGKKNTGLALSLYTNDSHFNSRTAQELANQWRALGVNVNLQILNTKDLMDNVVKPRKFDVLVFAQKFGADPDPFIFWHSSQIKDPGLNLSGLSDPQIDKLIVEARTSTNRQVTQIKYSQLDGLLQAKLPQLYLNQQLYIYALDQNIKNEHPLILYNTSDRFSAASEWYEDQKRVWK